MTAPLTITFDYQLNHYCIPADPVYDLSFRIDQLLKAPFFFKQDGSRIHVDEDATAIYYITHYKDSTTTYKKEKTHYDENLTSTNTLLKIRIDNNICNYSDYKLDKSELINFIQQQVKSILKLNVCISSKKVTSNKENMVIQFDLKIKK